MSLSNKKKDILEHAGYAAGVVATAGALSFVASHGADLISPRYEVLVAALLVPALSALRKWFQQREDETDGEGDAPKS